MWIIHAWSPLPQPPSAHSHSHRVDSAHKRYYYESHQYSSPVALCFCLRCIKNDLLRHSTDALVTTGLIERCVLCSQHSFDSFYSVWLSGWSHQRSYYSMPSPVSASMGTVFRLVNHLGAEPGTQVYSA